MIYTMANDNMKCFLFRFLVGLVRSRTIGSSIYSQCSIVGHVWRLFVVDNNLNMLLLKNGLLSRLVKRVHCGATSVGSQGGLRLGIFRPSLRDLPPGLFPVLFPATLGNVFFFGNIVLAKSFLVAIRSILAGLSSLYGPDCSRRPAILTHWLSFYQPEQRR